MNRILLTLSLALLTTTSVVDSAIADPDATKIPELIAALDDANVRYGASVALTRLGQAAVPELAEALDSDRPEIRVWSAYTLGEIGPPAVAATDALSQACQHPDDALRAAAVEALGKIGNTSQPAVEALAGALTDDNKRVRLRAAVALGQMGPQAHTAAEKLIASLSDRHIRDAARQSLVQIGPRAADALLASLDDDKIRFDVAKVLRSIDSPKARQAGVHRPAAKDLASLRLVLFDATRTDADRTQAAMALATLKEGGVGALTAAFEEAAISRIAASAFSKTGPMAVPMLVESLGHQQAAVRAAACDAVGFIGPDAWKARAKLIELLRDQDRQVRYRAVRALHELGQQAGPAVPVLIELILNSSEQEATRQWAIKTLVVTLPKTHDAVVKGLIEASGEQNNYGVRQLARQQLLKIDPEAAKQANIM